MDFLDEFLSGPRPPLRVTGRTAQKALEEALMRYTRRDLERIVREELGLVLPSGTPAPTDDDTKRTFIHAYIGGWSLPELMRLGRRIVDEVGEDAELTAVLEAYQDPTAGVAGTVKNLIFAANGPKPELVLRDAVSNDIEITRNAEYCLVYDRELPVTGLSFGDLIAWWRDRTAVGSASDRDVGLDLCRRLEGSLDNKAEQQVFRSYLRRYRALGFAIPALLPQVYLHYDPYTAHRRRPERSPLPRQRMDFLLLYSDHRRVVLEVDGRQHYADPDGKANTALYAEMVAEDRRLRLAGYEVYRFGGKELDGGTDADAMLDRFFADLHARA